MALLGVGLIVQLNVALPIFIGGALGWLIALPLRYEVLLASGAIAGEALTGVCIALLASVGITRLKLGLSDHLLTLFTAVAVLVTLVFFYLGSRPRE